MKEKEKAEEYLETLDNIKTQTSATQKIKKVEENIMPQVRFSKEVIEHIKKEGTILKGEYLILIKGEDPTILFFGERNKILAYDMKKNKWDEFKISNESGVEFHYYSYFFI